MKAHLLIESLTAIRSIELTQTAMAERMGIPKPKSSALLWGELPNMSERPLG